MSSNYNGVPATGRGAGLGRRGARDPPPRDDRRRARPRGLGRRDRRGAGERRRVEEAGVRNLGGTGAAHPHGASRSRARRPPPRPPPAATRSVTDSTSASGASRRTVSTSVSDGVSAPRNVIRQPCSRRASPKMRRPRSCRSPGGHASTARGPAPRSQPAGQAEQAAAEHIRGEVLLRDRDVSPRPAVAELAQERQHDALEDGVDRVLGQQAVEGARARPASSSRSIASRSSADADVRGSRSRRRPAPPAPHGRPPRPTAPWRAALASGAPD